MGPPQAGNNPTDIVACATCPSPTHGAAATLGFTIPAVNMVNTHTTTFSFKSTNIFSLLWQAINVIVSCYMSHKVPYRWLSLSYNRIFPGFPPDLTRNSQNEHYLYINMWTWKSLRTENSGTSLFQRCSKLWSNIDLQKHNPDQFAFSKHTHTLAGSTGFYVQFTEKKCFVVWSVINNRSESECRVF